MRFVNISTLLALVACTTGKEEVQEVSPELRRFESCVKHKFLSMWCSIPHWNISTAGWWGWYWYGCRGSREPSGEPPEGQWLHHHQCTRRRCGWAWRCENRWRIYLCRTRQRTSYCGFLAGRRSAQAFKSGLWGWIRGLFLAEKNRCFE